MIGVSLTDLRIVMFAEQLIGGSKMAAGCPKWPPQPFSRDFLAYRGGKNGGAMEDLRIAVRFRPHRNALNKV